MSGNSAAKADSRWAASFRLWAAGGGSGVDLPAGKTSSYATRRRRAGFLPMMPGAKAGARYKFRIDDDESMYYRPGFGAFSAGMTFLAPAKFYQITPSYSWARPSHHGRGTSVARNRRDGSPCRHLHPGRYLPPAMIGKLDHLVESGK